MASVEIESHPYLRWIPPPWAETGQRPYEWFLANTHRFLFTAPQIVASSAPYELGDGPNAGGVYFLVAEDELVYVGISGSVQGRLIQHVARGRYFDRYWCVGGMPEGFANLVECFYIHSCRPAWNEKYPPVDDFIRPFVDKYSPLNSPRTDACTSICTF